MASRKNRLDRILEIIAQNEIQTQGELADILVREGYNVTQATVSRDIRKLRLQKTRIPGGRQKYTAPEHREDSQETVKRSLRVMKDGIVSMDQAQNILVVKTVSGMAMAVAAALDALNFHEIVGCIAGDDTIMAAVRSAEDTKALIGRIREMLQK